VSFYVPARDPDGDELRWRLATFSESGISDPIGPVGGADAVMPPFYLLIINKNCSILIQALPLLVLFVYKSKM